MAKGKFRQFIKANSKFQYYKKNLKVFGISSGCTNFVGDVLKVMF